MITFGYKNRFSGLIRALFAIAVGVVMVVSKTNALVLAIRIIAAFLVATGVVTFFLGLKTKRGGENNLMAVNAVVDVFLGLLIFFFPEFVQNVVIYLIGFALLGFGLFQIVSLVSAIRVFDVGLWSFVMPVIVVIAGGLLVARPSFIGETIGIVAGVSLIIYGASELVSSWKMRKAIDKMDTEAPGQEDVAKAEDVDFEKVDEQ